MSNNVTTVTLSGDKSYRLTVNDDSTIGIERVTDGSHSFIGKLPIELVPHIAKLIDDDSVLPDFSELVGRFTPDLDLTKKLDTASNKLAEGLTKAAGWLASKKGK